MFRSKSDDIFQIVNYSILTLLFLAVLYPIWFVVIASVSDPTQVNLGNVLIIPKGINLDGYKKLFEYPVILTGYKNSLVYTVIGTCINLVVLLPASFALSRKELVFGRGFMIFLLITMYFSGGVIPLYLLIRNLNLMDTMWALILPGAFSVYNMIICRNFFIGNVSDALFESARIDGSSYTKFFLQIVLPLSKSIIAVMILFHALGHWNSYLPALYYIRDTAKYPLQLVMRNLMTELQAVSSEGAMSSDVMAEGMKMQESVKYAVIIAASIPVMLMYPLVQKHFVKGVMVGAIKG